MIEFKYNYGATPLTLNEQAGLKQVVLTHKELNLLESANILDGYRWGLKNKKLRKTLLTITSLFLLHQKMFGEVWEWAGTQRKTEKNIGVAPHQISENIQNLCLDVETWIEYQTYPWTEIGVRFHHRLVQIHPFVNGNGRHARIAANLLLKFKGKTELTWGSSDTQADEEKRKMYINALREADRNADYKSLIAFAIS